MDKKTYQAISKCIQYTNLQEIIQEYAKFGVVRTVVVEVIDKWSGKRQL